MYYKIGVTKTYIEAHVLKPSGQYTFAVTELFRVGDFQFVRPSILWYNNKTYFGADKGTVASFQNDLIAMVYDHNSQTLSYADVNDGAGYTDIYNHPACYIWLENGTFYCGQGNPHNVSISRYKSNATESVTSGFTQLANISNDYSYPKAFLTHDNKFAFNFRFDGTLEYDDVGLVMSDTSSIEGTFTATQITDSQTSGYRYYNSVPLMYGTNTKTYLTPTMSNETGSVYFAHVVLVTTDFNTFSNYQGTFSKNVVSTSPITDAEISANCLINGSFAADGVELKVQNTIQVDDVLYGTYIKSGTSDWYIYKIDGATKTEVNLSGQVSNLRTDNLLNNFMYWNGTNIVLSVLTAKSGVNRKEIWAIDTTLSIFSQKFVNYLQLAFNDPIKLPENLDEVTAYYAFWNDNQLGVTDYTRLVVTDDKFYV